MQLNFGVLPPGISVSTDIGIPAALGVTVGLGLLTLLYYTCRRPAPVRRVYRADRSVRERALFLAEEDATQGFWPWLRSWFRS